MWSIKSLVVVALLTQVTQPASVLGDDPKVFDQLVDSAIGRCDVSFMQAAAADDMHYVNDAQPGSAGLDKELFIASLRITPVTERAVDSVEVKEESGLIETRGRIRVRGGGGERQDYFVRLYRRGPTGWQLVSHRIVRRETGPVGSPTQLVGTGTGQDSSPQVPSSQGAYRPGNGVTLPRLVKEVKPNYTSDAMRAKIQGTVLVECVVLTDGTVGDVTVVRSLDKVYGLDDEAIKAAKQWRFVPGTRNNQPVPVLISIELTFTLRQN